MSKIKDLPALERPREKALRYGVSSLSNYELIALIISSGCANSSAMDIAYAMLSDNNGLFSLVKKPFPDLLNYRGIGKDKALKISATFEIAKRFNSLQSDEKEVIDDPIQLFNKYLPILSFSNQEHVYLVILDKRKRVVHEVNLYKGTLDSVEVSTTQIIQQIMIHGGSYFYLIHNHPSGEVEPSEDDMIITTELINECKKVGICMLDHLIIGTDGYFSFGRSRKYKKQISNTRNNISSEKF